ncbi:beta strand repeat-containing protein [Chloroflexota bacterium]
MFVINTRKIISVLVALVLALSYLFVFMPTPVQAAEITLKKTGAWSVPGNWIGGAVPTAIDTVIIEGNATATIDTAGAVCAGITLGKSTGSKSGSITFDALSQLTVGGTVTVGSGSGVGNIDMTNGGTLSAQGFTITAAGTWTPGTGTVELTASNTLPATFLTSFTNLTISGGTTSANTNFTVSGIFSIGTGATFTPGAAVVINSAGAAGTITGSGSIDVTRTAATADYSSQYKFTTNTLNNLTVQYNGAAVQTVSALSYGNLKINNSNGVTLAGDVTATGTLILTSGTVTTGASTVIMGESSFVAGGSSGSYIKGNLRKYVPVGVVSKTFEVGYDNYNPVTVAFSTVTSSGTLTANVAASPHSAIGDSKINSSKDVNVYWRFVNSGIVADSSNVTFNYVAGDFDVSADPDYFIIGKYNGGWTYPNVGTKTSTSTQATGVTLSGSVDMVVGETTDPLVTSITPSSGVNTGPVSITNLGGANFVDGATVKITKAGESDINATSVAWVSAIKLTCDFDLSGAATGLWDVVVTNPDAEYGTLEDGFTVGTETSPTVTSITPSTGVNTGSVSITDLAGTNFVDGATVKITKTGESDINATSVAWDSAIKLTCDFDLSGAATGLWNVVVTNPDTQYGTLHEGFTVTAPSPTLTSITPNQGINDGLISITNLAGTNFDAGATVKLTLGGESDINATSSITVSSTKITCNFNLTGAAVGAWDVVVTNPDENSYTLVSSFTVAQGIPYSVTSSGLWSDLNPQPTLINKVEVCNGATLTVDVTDAVCATLQIGGVDNTGTGTVTFSGSNPVVTVSGTVVIGGFGSGTRTGTLTFISGSTLTAQSVTIGAVVDSNPATGTVSMSDGGTIVANSLNVGVGGGTLTRGTGTVELTATNSLPSSEVTDYYNLTLSGGTTSATASLTVTGTLSVGAGATFTPGVAVVINSAGAAGTITGSGTIDVTRTAATADYSSQYKFTTNTLNNLTVQYNGAAAQTVSSLSYGNLKINNSNGVTLAGNATVTGTLILTSGKITTGASKVIISSSGSVPSGSSSSYVYGNLQKWVPTGAQSPTFEVGTASNYNPVTLAFNNVTGAENLTAKVTTGEHPNIASSSIDSSKDVNAYWTLTNSGITFDSYSIMFTFVSGDVDGGAKTSLFSVGRYDSGWTYPNIGTRTSTITQAAGVTSLSDFVVGEYPWQSYRDEPHTTVWGGVGTEYDGTYDTAYMYGEGFLVSQLYHIGFYDSSAEPNKVASTDPTSTAAGALSTLYYLGADSNAEAGTWHVVVYQHDDTPPLSYISSDPNAITEDEFEVDVDAIPEFSTVITGIAVVGICFGIYYWMRKRRLTHIKAS